MIETIGTWAVTAFGGNVTAFGGNGSAVAASENVVAIGIAAPSTAMTWVCVWPR